MGNGSDERLARARETAGKLFPPSSVSIPRFKVPAEIEADWRSLSVTTVLGDVWSRPGLEMKYRSMITIAALTALQRLEQLRAYIQGGLNVGLTRTEVCEIILHMCVYAGFPAAIEGFRIANEVFEELDRASGQPVGTQ
ncbi:MAG: carboxymuconolactone decarboxylase family protein [Chloroflexi bacterium]|nr:carboxymuconolactone decarboxylase family protein [Chloroflexota bacterium]